MLVAKSVNYALYNVHKFANAVRYFLRVRNNIRHYFEVNILRDRQTLYRINQEGLSDGHINSTSRIEVLPSELSVVSLAVTNHGEPINFRQDINFSVSNNEGRSTIMKQSSFYGEKF